MQKVHSQKREGTPMHVANEGGEGISLLGIEVASPKESELLYDEHHFHGRGHLVDCLFLFHVRL